MIYKKLKSFTLGELLVVMVVASIVVTSAYFALNTIQKQFFKLQQVFHNQQNVMSLERNLLSDFNDSSIEIEGRPARLKMINKTNTIRYRFFTDYIIRNKDTFFLKTKLEHVYFKGDTVKNGTVDALELRIFDVYNTNKLFVSKANDATFFMN